MTDVALPDPRPVSELTSDQLIRESGYRFDECADEYEARHGPDPEVRDAMLRYWVVLRRHDLMLAMMAGLRSDLRAAGPVARRRLERINVTNELCDGAPWFKPRHSATEI